MYVGTYETDVEIGLVLLEIVPRFGTTLAPIVVCSGAIVRFATAGG